MSTNLGDILSHIAGALSFINPYGRKRVAQEPFNWREALCDAGIVAGLNFFWTLFGVLVSGVDMPVYKAFLVGATSAGLGFFSTLAFKRGLYRRPVVGVGG